jgi:hypothetical protein
MLTESNEAARLRSRDLAARLGVSNPQGVSNRNRLGSDRETIKRTFWEELARPEIQRLPLSITAATAFLGQCRGCCRWARPPRRPTRRRQRARAAAVSSRWAARCGEGAP